MPHSPAQTQIFRRDQSARKWPLSFARAGAEFPTPSAGRKGQCRICLRGHRIPTGTICRKMAIAVAGAEFSPHKFPAEEPWLPFARTDAKLPLLMQPLIHCLTVHCTDAEPTLRRPVARCPESICLHGTKFPFFAPPLFPVQEGVVLRVPLGQRFQGHDQRVLVVVGVIALAEPHLYKAKFAV